MSERDPSKVIVRRPSKIKTDGRGRSVWVDSIKTAELELVSTQMLKKVLQSDDKDSRASIEQAVDCASDGVLARDPATGIFEVIDDDDLRAILDSESDLPPVTHSADVVLEPLSNEADSAADELSLVSTQMLRKVLGKAKPEKEGSAPEENEKDRSFNPYDNS
jgi:hypothetical protein